MEEARYSAAVGAGIHRPLPPSVEQIGGEVRNQENPTRTKIGAKRAGKVRLGKHGGGAMGLAQRIASQLSIRFLTRNTQFYRGEFALAPRGRRQMLAARNRRLTRLGPNR